MKYESYTEQMNSVPLKKRFHSQSKTSPTHPEFNMTTSPTQHSPQPTTPPSIINTSTTLPSDNNNQNTLDSSNDSMMITSTIDNSTTLPSTPVKEEVKTEKPLNALLSPTSTTMDALASLHLQSVSASNSPSNESTTTTTSSSTCNSSSTEDSGSNRNEPTTSSSSNTNSSTSVTDSPNSSNKKRRQFINRANKKKEDKGDSDSGEDSDDSENDSSEEDETLYCKCNRPASYGWMIACDRCDKWFHGRCLGLKKYQANSIGTYICPDCETSKKRKSNSINPSPSKSGKNNRSETTASSLAKDLPLKQITNHL